MVKIIGLLFFSFICFAEGEIILKDSQTWKELDLSALAKNLNRAQSQMGFAEWGNLLQPIGDLTQLRRRQVVVHELLEDGNFETFNRINVKFAQSEKALIHFIDEKLQINLLSEADLSGFFQKPSTKMQLFVHATSIVGFVQFAVYSWYNRQQGLGAAAHAGRGMHRWVWWNAAGEKIGLLLSVWILFASEIELYHKLARAHEQVMKARKLFELIHKTHHALQDSSVLRQSELGLKFALLSKAIEENPDFKEGIWGWFSSIDVYDAIKNSQRLLVDIAQVFGQIDAFVSVARLHREGGWVFANYLKSDELEFDFKALKNPLIKNSVANDFELTDTQNWVLTGPHACGKTTAMRSVGYAFVLGMSIGIVPAAHAEFTPVTQIATYMNVADSIVEGKSSFVAEHQRMNALSKISQGIKANERVLMLIDEPYAKTIQLVGEPMVVEFLSKVKNVNGLHVILATHFEAPSRVDGVQNYQPQIDDKLRPTFKIVPGAAEWWFNDAAKRTQFIEQYIVKADF